MDEGGFSRGPFLFPSDRPLSLVSLHLQDRPVTITGSPEAVDRAVRAVKRIVDSEKATPARAAQSYASPWSFCRLPGCIFRTCFVCHM